jgi:hypothetical protein
MALRLENSKTKQGAQVKVINVLCLH